MRRCWFVTALVLVTGLSAGSCTKIYTGDNGPTSPTPITQTTPTPTPTPTPVTSQVEFRVLGANLAAGSQVIVRHTDAVNGTTLYTGGVPYFASMKVPDPTIFLYIEGTAIGQTSTSTLQVQIYVDGRLFRDGFSQGFALNAEASGTYRR